MWPAKPVILTILVPPLPKRLTMKSQTAPSAWPCLGMLTCVLLPIALSQASPPPPQPPAMLVWQLEALADASGMGDWSSRVLDQLDGVASFDALAREEAEKTIDRLRQLVDSGRQLAHELEYGDLRSRVLQVAYTLNRWADVWSQIHAMTVDGQDASDPDRPDRAEFSSAVDKIEHQLSTGRDGAGWTHEPVDLESILYGLDGYERTGSSEHAGNVARMLKALSQTADQRKRQLGKHINSHWRNANIRVAITRSLMERYLPDVSPRQFDISDQVGSARVQGRASETTQLFLRLEPNPHQIRVQWGARGRVTADTKAYTDQFTAYHQNVTRYVAEKLVVLDRDGIHQHRAVANAKSRTHLRSMETNYDVLPLFGSIARLRAESEVDARTGAADYRVQQRVASMAQRKLDADVTRHVGVLEDQMKNEFYDPLRNLELEPVPIGLRTTETRIIARIRVAGPDQLSAYTARPQAPSASLASVQFHESAINNLIENFDLDGKIYTLERLYSELHGKLGDPDAELPDDYPEGVVVQFAPRDAIRVHFADDSVVVTVKLTRLSYGRRGRWRNLTVRGRYRPDPAHPAAHLVRREGIELTGHRLGIGDQVKLRGIFSKVMSRNRNVVLLNSRLVADPRLKDLQIQQFVVRDGWIGMAWGTPDRIAQEVQEDRTRQ